jgi:hypothetical protein
LAFDSDVSVWGWSTLQGGGMTGGGMTGGMGGGMTSGMGGNQQVHFYYRLQQLPFGVARPSSGAQPLSDLIWGRLLCSLTRALAMHPQIQAHC